MIRYYHFLLVVSITAITANEDLLDAYVRHVDKVNNEQINFSDDFQSNHSRKKRDIPIHWTHSEVLDKKGDVVLRWQPRHQEILFRVEARTKGYVAIGFSPDGGKEHADIVLGWIDDRTLKPHLLVRP